MKHTTLLAIGVGVAVGIAWGATDLASRAPSPAGATPPAATPAAAAPATPSTPSTPSTAPATAPATVPVPYGERTAHAPPKPGEIRTLTIKELGNFEYDAEKGGQPPADVRALNGMKIRLSGFMMPLEQSEIITEFALVPSLTSCCFGQPPGVQHIITVHCPKNKPATLALDPVSVEGTLKVDVQREDNYTVSIFEISGASVKPIELNLSKEVLQGAAAYQPKVETKN